MIIFHKILTASVFFFFVLPVYGQTIYELDFSTASGNVAAWFEAKKWEFRESMDKMKPRFESGKLVIEPTGDELGVIMREFDKEEYLQDVTRLRIEWGVEQYPIGADWNGPKENKRNTREAISFMVFFGDTKLDSGSFIVPNLPYFLSFFLGKNEKPDQVYFGNYWQEGGRYFCIPCDGSTGKNFVTEIDLSAKFKKMFGKDAPPITALSIEVDVQNTQKAKGRYAKAFIKHIRLSGR